MPSKPRTPEEIDAAIAAEEASAAPKEKHSAKPPAAAPAKTITQRIEETMGDFHTELLRSVTLGTAPTLAGIGAVGSELASRVMGSGAVDTPLGRAFEEGRAEVSARQDLARERSPIVSALGGVTGDVALAPLMGPTKTVAQGVVAGAKYGLARGTGEAVSSEVPKTPADVIDRAKDIARLTVMNAAAAGGGALVGKGISKVHEIVTGVRGKAGEKTVREVIKREVTGTTVPGPRATPTMQKQIKRAEQNIVREVLKGPDKKKVATAISSFTNPERGEAVLTKVINKVDAKNQAGYEAIAKKGGVVNASELGKKIDEAIVAAADSQDSIALAALEGFKADVIDTAAKASTTTFNAAGDVVAIPLTALRAAVTNVGKQANGTLGTLTGNHRSQQMMKYSTELNKVMDHFVASEGKKAGLADVAEQITKRNQRMNGLITMRNSLRQRVEAEPRKESVLVRGAKALTGGVTGGMLGTAAGSLAGTTSTGAILGAATGAVGGLAVPTARLANQFLTRNAIRRAQKGARPIQQGTLDLIKRTLAASARAVVREPAEEEESP